MRTLHFLVSELFTRKLRTIWIRHFERFTYSCVSPSPHSYDYYIQFDIFNFMNFNIDLKLIKFLEWRKIQFVFIPPYFELLLLSHLHLFLYILDLKSNHVISHHLLILWEIFTCPRYKTQKCKVRLISKYFMFWSASYLAERQHWKHTKNHQTKVLIPCLYMTFLLLFGKKAWSNLCRI